MRWVGWFGRRWVVVVLVLEPVVEDLLRQTAADLDLSPSEVAAILVGSSLVMSLGR
jgi:hypothetical protein